MQELSSQSYYFKRYTVKYTLSIYYSNYNYMQMHERRQSNNKNFDDSEQFKTKIVKLQMLFF